MAVRRSGGADTGGTIDHTLAVDGWTDRRALHVEARSDTQGGAAVSPVEAAVRIARLILDITVRTLRLQRGRFEQETQLR